jgi:UDP-N-acetylmuramyl pentapeptide phosphotransferase/UDP-N-acetylglucosamine-1-phosphate transferase
MSPFGIAFGVALVVATAAIASLLVLLVKPLLVRYVMAHPNARSSHKQATPQGAGIAVVAALVIVLLAVQHWWPQAVSGPLLFPVILAAIGLAVLGLVDDARQLPATVRFAAQLVAALLLAFSLPRDLRILPDLIPFWAERGLIVFGTVYLINAINFLDGIDWITVAQVVPMTLGVAALAYLGATPPNIGTLALALLGAMLGFAIFNKHPAQVFLGDAGSLPIGLLLALMLTYVAGWNLVAAILLALYTLLDSGITLIRRSYNREPIFRAHRSHFYQRAVIGGMSVPAVSLRVFVLCLLLASLAVATVLTRSHLADLILLALGVIATGYVLYLFARGRG